LSTATAYSIYSQLPPISGGCLLGPLPEDAPCRTDREPREAEHIEECHEKFFVYGGEDGVKWVVIK